MERGNRKEKVRKKKEKKGKRNEIRIDEKKHKNISPKKWLNNYPLVSEWLSQFGNIEKRVEENGGILAIDHFLPSQVAMFAYQVLDSIEDWETNAANRDTKNNVDHHFNSTKFGKKDLSSLLRVCEQACPGSFSSLSAGRYGHGDFIEIHDDRAYTHVQLDEEEEGKGKKKKKVILCSRRMAFVLYLSPTWKEKWGGLFLDHEDSLHHGQWLPPPDILEFREKEKRKERGEDVSERVNGEGEGKKEIKEGEEEEEEEDDGRFTKSYTPAFNRLLLFKVPRFHEVTKVTQKEKFRYSIFGWFLDPGITYPLLKEKEEEEKREEEEGEKEEEERIEGEMGDSMKRKRNEGSSNDQEVEILPIITRSKRSKRRKKESKID